MTNVMLPDPGEPTGFYGIYRGICTTDADPIGLNRIKAIVPQLFGNTETQTDWALPCQPVGVLDIPAPGTGVWLQFEGGDLNYPVYVGVWQLTPSGGGSGWPASNGRGSGNLIAATLSSDIVGYNMTDNGTGGFSLSTDGAGAGISIVDNTTAGTGGIDLIETGAGNAIKLTTTGGTATEGINLTTESADVTGINLTDNGSGGINITEGLTGDTLGISITDNGGAGIFINENGPGDNLGVNIENSVSGAAGGVTIADLGTTGVFIESVDSSIQIASAIALNTSGEITVVGDGISFSPSPGYVRGSLSGNPFGMITTAASTSISSATPTQLPSAAFSGATPVLYGGMTFSSNVFTVPVAGVYGYVCSNFWNNNNTALYESVAYQNGSVVTRGQAHWPGNPNTGSSNVTISAAGFIVCSASDLLGMGVFQNSGSTLTVNAVTPFGNMFFWLVSQ
jgi:Type VI secretion system/phage-baseplate injector OB domain